MAKKKLYSPPPGTIDVTHETKWVSDFFGGLRSEAYWFGVWCIVETAIMVIFVFVFLLSFVLDSSVWMLLSGEIFFLLAIIKIRRGRDTRNLLDDILTCDCGTKFDLVYTEKGNKQVTHYCPKCRPELRKKYEKPGFIIDKRSG